MVKYDLEAIRIENNMIKDQFVELEKEKLYYISNLEKQEREIKNSK
jgi:hypothetical protein